jgi:hypothetical protein
MGPLDLTTALPEDVTFVSVCASLSIRAAFAYAFSVTLVLLHNLQEHAVLFTYMR